MLHWKATGLLGYQRGFVDCAVFGAVQQPNCKPFACRTQFLYCQNTQIFCHERGAIVANITGASHNVSAVRVVQDGVILYIASVPAHVFSELGVVHEYNPDLDPSDPNQGYQRSPSRQHASKIKTYLLDPTHKRLLPSATLLCSRSPLKFTPVGDGDVGTLELARPMYIVDGQHRSLGLAMASEEDSTVGSFTVPAVIMVDVDRSEEIRQFYTINKTARGVRSDLADTLLKNIGALSDPAKQWLSTAIEVANILNTTPKGPWQNAITQPNSSGGIVTQKSKTDSLKLIIDGALRGVEPATVAAAVNNFWSALRFHMPECFAEPKNYVLQKSVGVFAWNEVASEHFRRRMISDRDLSEQRARAELADLGDYITSGFWATRPRGGIAPNYGSRGGMHALALEIISEFHDSAAPSGGVHL